MGDALPKILFIECIYYGNLLAMDLDRVFERVLSNSCKVQATHQDKSVEGELRPWDAMGIPDENGGLEKYKHRSEKRWGESKTFVSSCEGML